MFKKLRKRFLPNPFDAMLKRTAKRGGKRILFPWNRGLGDIPLGLYAMVLRIREFIPDAEIVFLTRENLRDGFSLLEGVQTWVVPDWKRGEALDVRAAVAALGQEIKSFDLVIEKANPTDWVEWQKGRVVPRLKWKSEHDALWKKFDLDEGITYIGVQVVAETNYGLWRNWPQERWSELFDLLEREPNVRVLLFGFGDQPQFTHKGLIDLRGKTNLFELISVIKNRCQALVVPDSGIASMAYYLDTQFPLHLISLWADTNHGILKQGVASPNAQLVHSPLVGAHRDLSQLSADRVFECLFPLAPWQKCARIADVKKQPVERVGCIILAGGQGTRLGFAGPKGMFPVQGKSLFHWICEQVSRKDLPIAVMTSPLNHQETVAFFERHSLFHLDIHFFQQEMRPLLDEEKRPIELRPGEIVYGPNGNGSLFRSFVKSGLADLFAQKGIDVVQIVQVDNPLVQIFDEAFLTYHRESQAEVTLKCVERLEGENSMGVLVERKGKLGIVEYTEIAPEYLSQRGADGHLAFRFANAGQWAMNLSFMREMASVDLPVHWVRKKMQIGPQLVFVWKGEHFIFDVLPFAERAEALCAPRETCYAPLKSLEALEAVQNAIQNRMSI